MESSIINGIIYFVKKLNYWYEFSFTHYVFKKLSEIIKESSIFGPLYRLFKIEKDLQFLNGSILIYYPVKFIGEIINIGKRLFTFICKLNKTSLNRRLFYSLISPLQRKDFGITMYFSLFFGIFLVRTVVSFSLFNIILCIVFFVLTLLDYSFIAKTIAGSVPGRIFYWLLRRDQ